MESFSIIRKDSASHYLDWYESNVVLIYDTGQCFPQTKITYCWICSTTSSRENPSTVPWFLRAIIQVSSGTESDWLLIIDFVITNPYIVGAFFAARGGFRKIPTGTMYSFFCPSRTIGVFSTGSSQLCMNEISLFHRDKTIWRVAFGVSIVVSSSFM